MNNTGHFFNDEIWKPIEGFPYYEVSNFGRVRSIDRIVYSEKFGVSQTPRYIKRKSKILKYMYDQDGYCRVNIYCEKKVKNSQVHRLVALTFLKNDKNLEQVNHIDGNKKNNSVANLEWVSCKENHKHSEKIGLKSKGESRPNSKLTLEKVRFIIENTDKIPQAKMAKMFGVSPTTLNKVVKGITWSHATGLKKDPRAYLNGRSWRKKYEHSK